MKPSDKKILLACIILNFVTVALIIALLVCMHYSAVHYFNYTEKQYPEEEAAVRLILFVFLEGPIMLLWFGVSKIALLLFSFFFLLSGILLAVYTKTKSPKTFKASTHTAVAIATMTLFTPFIFIIFEVDLVRPNFTQGDIGLIIIVAALTVICVASIILHSFLFYGVKKANEPIAPEDPFEQL